MPSSISRRAWHDRRRLAALWIGVLTGPIVWATLLELNYAMSYVSCETRSTWFLHLADLVAIALVAGAGWLAWQAGPAGVDERTASPDTPETSESRSRWMAAAGLALSIWFAIVILAMEVPTLVLKTCQ